jgi:ligand-binding sensor domain-containing protein
MKVNYLCLRQYYFASTVFVLLLAGSLSAQQPYLRFISSIQDFGDGHLNTIYQDKQGFIWLGATSGAYRFDGTDYFAVELHDSILNKSVSAIFEDSNEMIWFGFEDGNILYYDRFKINVFQPKGKLPSGKITDITEGMNSSLWFGTYGEGIFILQNGSLSNLNTESGLSDNYIYCFLPDNNLNIWAGTDNGINICKLENGNPVIRTMLVSDGLPDFIVQSLEMDSSGIVWIGMQDKGICYFDPENNTFITPDELKGWKSGSVTDMYFTSQSIWILTPGTEITEYNLVNKLLTTIAFLGEPIVTRINSIIGDSEGNVWLISNTDVYLSLGGGFEYLNSINGYSFINIHALVADNENRLWFANDDYLFSYKINNRNAGEKIRTYPIQNFPEINKIMSLYRDNFGFLWIGTFGNGLVRFDPESGKRIHISEKDGLLNGNVLTIKGSATEIWFGTLGGAFRCIIDERFSKLNFVPEFESYGQAEGLSNNYIYNLFIDKTDRVWFATDGSGVCYYENDKFHNISVDSAFADKVIYSVTVGSEGMVWMNAANEGLFSFNGKKIDRVLHDEAHKNLSFSGILANPAGELVIAYDNGIDVLNTLTGTINHFENNAGLTNINPDLNTLSMDSSGCIWIGTSKGIIKYLKTTGKIWDHPQSKITDVNIFLQKSDHRNKNVFKYSQNYISFNYAGLWYQYPEQVEYLIKLEGHDLDWIKTKNKNVIYSSLPPGKYTFKVKSALYNNFEAASSDSYSFTIGKPFWLSLWFFALVLISLGIAGYLYIMMREKRIKKKEDAIREKIRFQFENLKSQINPHFLFNSFSTLIALIDQDQETAIEYVEELSNLFRNVLEFKDQDVITLSEEFKIIDNYYRLQKKRYGDNLDLKITKIETADQIKIPPLTLQLVVENAIKHNVVSKENPLQIHIFADPENQYLFVENNLQQKKEDIMSMGIGINNIIDRYNMLTDKKIQIVKTEKSFRIGLPYIN